METSSKGQKPLDILILAAGLGTRMKSDHAKVLHKLDGRPFISHVCRTALALTPRKLYVVVGHQGEEVKQAVLREAGDLPVEFVWQDKQLGTGHAVNAARDFFNSGASTLLVLSGDVPVIRTETLRSLVQQHSVYKGTGAACTILSVRLEDPTGYGRMVRDSDGLFSRIVEQKDAVDDERLIKEINSGIYCFDTEKLFAALARVKNENAQGEYYLTDVPALLKADGDDVAVHRHNDSFEIEGVNNRSQLAELERLHRKRINSRLMLEFGVTLLDPQTTYVSEDAVIGRDTILHPNVTIEGRTTVGRGCEIRSGSRITDSSIADGVEILDNCIIADSTVEEGCKVGPMAHLRGKATMRKKSKVGNFVELKKTDLGEGAKANHLTYLGDATVGEKTNIGAGTITCNYDGVNKNPTTIGKNVKIGSDTMLVAPVKIGDGSVTGAGSVVTKDVPEDSLVYGAPAAIKKNLKKEKDVSSKGGE